MTQAEELGREFWPIEKIAAVGLCSFEGVNLNLLFFLTHS